MPKLSNTRYSKTGPRLLACLSMVTMLAACGYKGPLYMPPPPAPDESLTTPPPSATLPADTSSPAQEPASESEAPSLLQ